MSEVNLLDRYPQATRPIEERGAHIQEDHRQIARQFGREYFDGDRLHGYGGYSYHPRFWRETVKRFRDFYGLTNESSVLDVGCAKGYMLHDFKELLPGLTIAGIDISPYALEHSLESVRSDLQLGNAKDLPFADNSFDLVISINTIHNLDLEECRQALKEIQRVSRGPAFVTMDAWRNEEERERLLKWNLTALTYMDVQDWEKVFEDVKYTGDYYWFIAA
ncbi:MAG: class I SAM-dependent methyltransferase [Nitrospirales bacterium]|nr:class I SAM-dependent methyltransferase [Nitrospira sp.]MDR4502361.1 class I SAM-dependent methyltransferase [Nitrospirales bacterium]